MGDSQDNGGMKPGPKLPELAVAATKIRVMIEYDPASGDVALSGPGDQLLLYGLLVAGLDLAMKKSAPTEVPSKLLVPRGGRFGPF